MQITNGTVEYARTVRPADFESKSFKVTLSFSIADGEDEVGVVERVGTLAIGEVHRRLGLAAPAPAPREVVEAKVAEAHAVQEEPTKGKGRRKSGNAPETVGPTTAPVSQPSAEPEPTDDTGETDPTVSAVSSGESAPQSEASSAPTPNWSDVDLNKLLERRRKEGISALQLREAINSFAPRMSQIPQDKRAAFVGNIESLPVQGKAPAAE